MIAEKFPSTTSLNWGKAFDNNIELLGRILRDILRVDIPTTGRPGPRPSLDRTQSMPDLERLLGRDPNAHPYTVLPFHDAFRQLVGNRSTRALQNKLGMSKSHVHRLLHGKVKPTQAEMERLAGVFDRQPGYFAEYRVNKIAEAIGLHLVDEPEVSIRVYEKMTHAASK